MDFHEMYVYLNKAQITPKHKISETERFKLEDTCHVYRSRLYDVSAYVASPGEINPLL